MCLALALSFPEQMATSPARQRLKLGFRLPTTRSKLFLRQLSARSPGRRRSTSRAALAQEKRGPTGGLPIRAPTRSDAPPSAPAAPPSATAARAAPQPRLSADCDLSYLLTGVFSAPASGVFVRRPAASAGGWPASPCADPRPFGRRVPGLLFVLHRACLVQLQDPR